MRYFITFSYDGTAFNGYQKQPRVRTVQGELEKALKQINDNKEVTKAVVSKFDLYNSDKLNDYNNVFKIDNSKIESITNNGGQYSNSSIDKAIDNNLNTHILLM